MVPVPPTTGATGTGKRPWRGSQAQAAWRSGQGYSGQDYSLAIRIQTCWLQGRARGAARRCRPQLALSEIES